MVVSCFASGVTVISKTEFLSWVKESRILWQFNFLLSPAVGKIVRFLESASAFVFPAL